MTDPVGPLQLVRTSTFFRVGKYCYFNWETLRSFNPEGNGKVEDLGIPLESVGAACVNPLDLDVVWLFERDLVVDYRVSTRTVLGLERITEHPIFRELPSVYHKLVDAVVLDPRSEEDLAAPAPASRAAPAPLAPATAPTWDGVVVVVAPDEIGPDRAIHVTRNQPRAIPHTLTFKEKGNYRVTVPKTLNDELAPWHVELSRAEADPRGHEVLLQDIAEGQSVTVTLHVLAQNPVNVPTSLSGHAALPPRHRVPLRVRPLSPRKPEEFFEVPYECLLLKTPRPLVHVYGGERRATLEITSLRSAVLIEERVVTPAVKGGILCYLNGGGSRAAEVYQLSNTQRATWVEGAAPKVEKATGWFNGREPWAGVTARLRPRPATSIQAEPGESSSFQWGTEPPETLKAIPGFRDRSLDQDHDAWLNGLPSGKVKSELPKRMQDFIDRIFKTPTRDVPDFLRTFIRVYATYKNLSLAWYAMPDLLAVGSERNFFRLPLSASAGSAVAEALGCILPTGRMTLQCYLAEGSQRMYYQGLDPNVSTFTDTYKTHHRMIEDQRKSQRYVLGRLTVGQRKELVIDESMFDFKKRKDTPNAESYPVVFWGGVYGYRRTSNQINLAHPGGGWRAVDAKSANVGEGRGVWHPNYHDEYAQGIRLVARTAYLREGRGPWKPVKLVDVLASADRHPLISFDPLTTPYFPKDKGAPAWRVPPPPVSP